MSTLSPNLIRPTEKRTSSEINHLEIFSTQMAELCMSEEFSDVAFEIQDEKIPGHAIILATRSKYFKALLFRGVAECKQKLFKLQVPIEAFKVLLKYIYSGQLSLSHMREENILDTLVLVNQCGCKELEQCISQHLCEILSLDNVCAILDTARVVGSGNLQNVCHTFLDKNATDVLLHESFKNLTEETLKDIISRDTFLAPELQIFNAVKEWCKHNSNVETGSVLSLVRLSLLSFDQIFQEVQDTGLFDSDTLLDVIKQKLTPTLLPYRKSSWQEENLVAEKFGARITQYDTTSYNLLKGYAHHSITDDHDSGIIVELGSVTYINHIKLHLLESDSRSYSYFVDVSVDKTLWERVVDHQVYQCRSWQFLYFPSRAVRYVKLVGTHNSINAMFEVVSCEAYYTAEIPKMIDGVVAPTRNVATIEMGATVVADAGTYRSENLLNGDFINFNTESGSTYHFIGKGSIMVQLGQPYVIGSMRFIWDWEDWSKKYSYYIETSINKKDWEIVVNKQKEDCSLWQNLEFEPRAMVFIKIVGTTSTVVITEKEVFACVHFECPSQILNTTDNTQKAGSKIIEEIKID